MKKEKPKLDTYSSTCQHLFSHIDKATAPWTSLTFRCFSNDTWFHACSVSYNAISVPKFSWFFCLFVCFLRSITIWVFYLFCLVSEKRRKIYSMLIDLFDWFLSIIVQVICYVWQKERKWKKKNTILTIRYFLIVP